MSTGFVLNIPQEMINRLEDADKKIEKLAKTSEDAQTRIVSAFKSINTHGIDAFINKLTEAQTKLANLGNTKVDFSANASIFSSLTSNARKAIDEVNNVVSAIGKIKTASGETGKMQNPFLGSGISEALAKLNAEIEQAKRNFSELQNQFTHLNVPAGDKSNLTNIQNEAQFLMEYIRVLEKEKNGLISAKNALAEANKTLQQKDPFKAKVDDLSRESLEALRYKDSMQAMKEFYAEQDKEMKKAAKEAEADRKKREKEEKATAERIATYDSKARKERYKAYTSTYEGAMRTSDRAKTLLQEQQAIKNLEAARAKLNKTDSDYANKLRNLNQRILEHKNNIDKATAGSKNLQTQHRSLMDISGQLARRLALVFSVSQITGYVKKLIEVRGEFELQQRSLQAILQNKDEANRIWQQTVDLAVRSPFRVKELVSYTKQLAAYRIESDKLFETNKMLADISAGLGVDMQRLILAFGQVRSAAYLRGTELRQFTEAGIPILEQLAQYFTELEGRAVSVGDVFERVSRRMVSFADVEEIFKRMTSEGGTFYRMQEIQAETLQGQISNLKDSVDIMLNDIGKAHQDTLASSVAFVRSIVQNWRLLATAIQQAGFALAGFSAVKIIRALRLTGDALVEATVKARGLTAATAKLKLSMMDLGKWIKAHPAFFAVGLIASATHALIQYGKSVDAMNEKYDEMSQRELRRVDTLKELNEQAEKNNQAIKDAIAEQDNASEGTDEYATAEENLSRARGKNISLLERLKKEYPEVYASITKQEDGTVDLTKAIEEQNRVAQRQIALQQQAKGGWFQQSLTKNYEDAVEALGNYQSSLDKVAVATYEMRQNLSMALSSEQIEQEGYDAISSIADQMMDIKDSVEGFNLIEEIFGTKAMSNAEISALVEPIRHALVELGGTVPEYNWALGDFFDNIENLKSLPVTINEMVSLDPKKGKENAGDYVESVLDEFGIVNDTIREWAKRKIEKIIGFKLVWGDGEGDGGGELTEDWAKRVDAAIKDINNKVKRDSKNISDADLFPRPKAGQTKEAYLALAKEVIGIAEMTYNETQQIEDESMVNRTKALSPYADEVKKILNLFKDNNKDKDDAAIKILNKRIGLIKEMYSEYQKGEKVIGEAAEKQVSDAYAKTFKEAFEDTGINLTGLVIDKEKLTELQNAGNEAGEIFSEAMLAKMNEVAEAGTYIRNVSDKAKDQIKLDEGFVGYIYDDAEKSRVKTQIKTLEELYKYFDKVTGKAKEVKGQGTLTIGYGHALQTLDEAKKYLGITLEQAEAEELLNKDIQDRIAPLNTLLDKYNELIVTQEQYDTLFNNFYQGGLGQALQFAFSDNTDKLEAHIKKLDTDLASWGSSFAQEWGDNWLEEFKQLETKAERFAKVLEIASVTTLASGGHIEKNQFYGENAMKARSARRAAEFRGDLEIVKLLEKAAVDVSQIDFTNIEGVVAILERLRPIAEKEGEEAVNTLNQVISKFTAEIGFTAKKNADKELLAQVQKKFDQYDLSLELKKLNIPPDIAESLFDIEYLDLKGLKENVINEFSGTSEALKTELQKGFGNIDWLTVKNLSSGELMEAIKKALKDIDDLEEKQQLESAKRFAKFLTQNLDQTKVVLQQRGIDIAFAKKEFDEGRISAEQFAETVKNIVAQSNEEISKFNLEKFKETPEYIQAMGDLASYSKKEIQTLIKTLNDAVTQNAHLFDADEVKAYMDALKKAQEELESRDVFKWGDFGRATDIIQTQKEIEDKKADIETNKAELETQKQKLAELQAKLDNLKAQQKATQDAGGDTTQVDADIAKTTSDIVTANEEIGKTNNEIKTNTGLLSLLGDKMKGLAGNMGTTLAIIDAIVHGINDTVQGINTLYGEIGSVMESFGKETDFSTGFGKGAMLMDTFAKSSQAAADGWDAFKNGDPVGVVVNVVKSITEIIKGINAYHDAGLEVIIQDHLEEVERLQKEYEKLEWAIDRAFSFKKYGMVAEQQENLAKQIENTQKAIAAEEDKKDTDKERIEELQGEIEEASKQIQELYDNLRADIVGTFEDLSSTLGDAMISALQQGEDALKAWSDSVNDIITDIVGQLLIQKYLEPQIANLVNDYYSKIMPKNARAENKYQEYLKAIERGDSATAEKLIEEYKKLAEQAIGEVPQINEDATKQFQSDLLASGENFKDLIPDWLINSTKEGGGLSALTKGISGMSEQQAEILTAYWNSVRGYTASIDSKMDLVLANLGAGAEDNPMLEQMRLVAKNTSAINTLLSSLVKGGHSQGGQGLKVFMD